MKTGPPPTEKRRKNVRLPQKNEKRMKKNAPLHPKKTKKTTQFAKKSKKDEKKLKKACAQGGFLIFSLLSVPSGAIHYRVSPLEYHSLDMQCVGRVGFSFLLASANRWKLALFASLGTDNRPGRGKKFPQGAGQNGKKVTNQQRNLYYESIEQQSAA